MRVGRKATGLLKSAGLPKEMKLKLTTALLTVLALASGWAVLAPSLLADGPAHTPPPVVSPESQEFVPGRVLVGFKPRTLAESPAPGLGLAASGASRFSGPATRVIPVGAGEEVETAERLKRGGAVDYAELDYVVRTLSEPNNSSRLPQPWNLSQINAPSAWNPVGASPGPIIAIVDTGVYAAHPDLRDKVLPGYDFVNEDDDPSDDNGHGTHVAGIIAASINKAAGIAGVSPGSRIMPLKVLDAAGAGSTSNVARAIIWATDHGARIVNLSLGSPKVSSALGDAIGYAYKRGVLVIAASGNSFKGSNSPIYPAAYPEVIAVAATTSADAHASYSSAGPYVDLAAPGGDPLGPQDNDPGHWIASTYWTGGAPAYARLAGTSQASPHVAGVAALVLSVDPGLSNTQVEEILESTATDLGPGGKDDLFGHGRVDARASVLSAAAGNQASPRVPTLPSGSSRAYRVYFPLVPMGYGFGW